MSEVKGTIAQQQVHDRWQLRTNMYTLQSLQLHYPFYSVDPKLLTIK